MDGVWRKQSHYSCQYRNRPSRPNQLNLAPPEDRLFCDWIWTYIHSRCWCKNWSRITTGDAESSLIIWLAFTPWWGIASQLYYAPSYTVSWNTVKLFLWLPRTPALLFYCVYCLLSTAPSTLGAARSFAILGEWILCGGRHGTYYVDFPGFRTASESGASCSPSLAAGRRFGFRVKNYLFDWGLFFGSLVQSIIVRLSINSSTMMGGLWYGWIIGPYFLRNEEENTHCQWPSK